MADTIQIVCFDYVGARERILFDLADIDHYAYTQGSLKPTAGPKTQTFSVGDSRYGGGQQVDEKVGNAALAWTIHVRGTSADDCAAQAEEYLRQIDHRVRGRYLKWRQGGVSGVSRPVYSPIRGAATWTPDYDSLKLQSGWALDLQISVPVAPLAEWACMDIEDRLDQDTFALGDWQQLVGAAAVAVDTSARTATASASSLQVFQHVGRGYDQTDWDVILPFTWKAAGVSPGAPAAQALCKVLGSNLYLGARAAGGTFAVFANKSGTITDVSATTAFALTQDTTYWLRATLRGRLATASIYTADPASPATTPAATVSTTLDAATYAMFRPAGRAGIGLTSTVTASMPVLRGGITARPFVFPAVGAPQRLQLRDVTPGKAPARADVVIAAGTGSALHTFGMLSEWAQHGRNLIRNGHFTTAITAHEWSNLAVSIRHALGGVITSDATAGGALPESGVITFATAGSSIQEGIHATIPVALQAGCVYTARMWVRAKTAAADVQLNIYGGMTGAPDFATSGIVTVPTTTWTELVCEFPAAADYPDGCMIVLKTGQVAAAISVQMSAVTFTDQPAGELTTLDRQQRAGFGGRALGHVRGNACEFDPTGWARGTVAAFAAHGEVLRHTAPSSSTTYRAEWWVDAGGMDPDEYADQIAVLVWIRWLLDPSLVAPRAMVWTEPEASINAGSIAGKRAYSSVGSTGKRLDTQPLGGAQRALWKPHGMILLPTDPELGRTRLQVGAQLAAGTTGTLFGISDLMLLPARAVQCTPTAAVSDASYPRITNQRPFEKRVSSDGRGYLRQGTQAAGTDTGMGGPAIELPSGRRGELMVAMTENVPDDPTAAAASDSYGLTTDVRVIVTPRSRLMRG